MSIFDALALVLAQFHFACCEVNEESNNSAELCYKGHSLNGCFLINSRFQINTLETFDRKICISVLR